MMAAAGLLIALYLGFYQLHMIAHVWEPFFGEGTRRVVDSSFSRSLPVPDALLGAAGYLSDMVLVALGDQNRWSSKPWVVILYAMVVVLMGMVSFLLLILQPFVLHAWCTLCMTSALLSLAMLKPAFTELIATIQYLRIETSSGTSFWEAVRAA